MRGDVAQAQRPGVARQHAEHAADASCPNGEAYELSSTSPNDRRSALPAGTWALVARNDDGSEYYRGPAFPVTVGIVTLQSQ